MIDLVPTWLGDAGTHLDCALKLMERNSVEGDVQHMISDCAWSSPVHFTYYRSLPFVYSIALKEAKATVP